MEGQAMARRRKRRRSIPLGFLLLLVLPIAAAGILLIQSGALSGLHLGTTDGEIAQALDELLEKNPETKDYVAHFEGVTPVPESVDLSGELSGGGIPLLMQWDERWGYCRYGTGLIGYTGCGPTCLSMVLLGLTGDETYHPAYVAQFATKNGYCVPGNGTSWSLFSEGAEALGLTAKELPLWEATMAEELAAGHPIICIMGKGDFTDGGHYIVLTGYQDGEFAVLDPNRKENCHGWSYEQLEGQIRNLWSYTAA